MRKSKKRVFAKAEFNSALDMPVKAGLAITPQQMYEMSKRGVPISSASCDMATQGEDSPSFEIPVDRLRGADVNMVWEAEQEVKDKVYDKYTIYKSKKK